MIVTKLKHIGGLLRKLKVPTINYSSHSFHQKVVTLFTWSPFCEAVMSGYSVRKVWSVSWCRGVVATTFPILIDGT